MRKSGIIFGILSGVLAVLAGICIYGILVPEPEGLRRQRAEEELAERYLQMLSGNTKTETQEGTENRTEKGTEAAFSEGNAALRNPSSGSAGAEEDPYPDFEDDAWYMRDGTVYTPDYAKGVIACVLEIPKPSVRIRRGVYTGTEEEIAYDLSIWMVTQARPDMIPGKTHYVIYGHNHTVQDLSFNRLPNLECGDEFTLTCPRGRFRYLVTEIRYLTRESVARDLADNFSLDKSLCFIVTCARGAHAGLDLVVTGALQETLPVGTGR